MPGWLFREADLSAPLFAVYLTDEALADMCLSQSRISKVFNR